MNSDYEHKQCRIEGGARNICENVSVTLTVFISLAFATKRLIPISLPFYPFYKPK